MVQSQSVTQLALFDYTALDTETRIVVQQRTTEIKALMKRAASDIIEIGQKLIEVKIKLGHGNFGDWLEAEFDWSDFTARQFMNVANVFKSENFSDLNIGPSALYLLAAPSTPESARIEAIARAEEGESISHQSAREIVSNHRPIVVNNDFETIRTEEFREDTEAYIEERVEAPKLRLATSESWQPAPQRTFTVPKIEQPEDDALDPPLEESQVTDIRKSRMNAGMYTSATPEWYTPKHIIDQVIKVFGEIDLDPCSNAKGDAANVDALSHYTIEDNGLIQPWHGKVYMNPPYGDEIGPWVNRLVQAYQNEEIREGIALLPGRTDTAWFQPLFDYPICFVRGRLKFSGAENSATFPSVIVYLGVDITLFRDVFDPDIGPIVERSR